jgi:hypothetical protein
MGESPFNPYYSSTKNAILIPKTVISSKYDVSRLVAVIAEWEAAQPKSHIHAHLMVEYAKDALETDKPWERWERAHITNLGLWQGLKENPPWIANNVYRRKEKL